MGLFFFLKADQRFIIHQAATIQAALDDLAAQGGQRLLVVLLNDSVEEIIELFCALIIGFRANFRLGINCEEPA